MFPIKGDLAAIQLKLEGTRNTDLDQHPDILMDKYIGIHLRKQILNSCLHVIKTYSHCSIACQTCLLVLDNLKTQFDILDIVTLQKFVINEFVARHTAHHNLILRYQEEGIDKPIRRYQIDHNNLQSAQVNQMTLQLKDKVSQIKQLFEMDEAILKDYFGETNFIKYQDLISPQDIEFWDYLCNKDFKRLHKLQTAGLGDGVFFDDSDDDSDSENEKEVHKEKGARGLPMNDGDDEDEYDHDNFMEQMLNDMHLAQDEELKSAEQLKKQLEE